MSVRREVSASVGLGLLATVGIGIGGLISARAIATDEALFQATQATELLARTVIEPVIDDDLATGDADAIAELDAAVQAGIPADQILILRVWAADGTILYADDPSEIGRQFPLGSDEQEVLASGISHAELSDLEKAENAGQTQFDRLLEVYVAIEDPQDTRLLFETYQSPDPIATTTRRTLRAFAPVVLGGLLLLGLVQGLLAWRLARRLERGRREREGLMQQALDASENERRAIAADLHDGVVQELVGVTFTLEALAGGLTEPGLTEPPEAEPGQADPGFADPAHADPDFADPAHASAALTSAAAATRRSVRSLRSLLVDIYPPNLDQAGLAGAIADLASAAEAVGTKVSVAIDPDVEASLAHDARAAMYRTAREALSNVRRHARARSAEVVLTRGASGRAVLTVRDEGIGFDPSSVAGDHVGLRLLADLAASVGGTFSVDSATAAGTAVRLEIPQ